MNSETATETFNLLSIGQRGVGKTVFLAGSYAELHADRKRLQQLWFDCQDSQAQANIERLFSYIVQTGTYPPPTMKVTNFSFSLKRRRLWGVQTLSHFRWLDIPGEICNIHNRDFRAMVSDSHGCCLFIDAYTLVHNNGYLQALEDITKQVMAIASLAHLNDFKYPFALILTKCDLLEPGRPSQQLEKFLQPLTTRLDAVRANYQTFYSLIPIVHIQDASIVRVIGAAAPLLWLVWELSKPHNSPGLMNMNNLLELVTRLWLNNFQVWQELVNGALHSRVRLTDKVVGVKQILDLYLLPTARSNLLLVALAIVALVGFIGLASP
jgi:hypothetical protein